MAVMRYISPSRAARRGAAGFTLVEILVTVLIVTLATALVASGLPVAIRTWDRVRTVSRAQILLSTTVTRLREELSTAWDVEQEEGVNQAIDYTSGSTGLHCRIQLGSGSDGGIEVVLFGSGSESETVGLVTEAAESDLHVTYEKVSTKQIGTGADGSCESFVVVFENLEVRKDGSGSDATPYAKLGELAIRVIALSR